MSRLTIAWTACQKPLNGGTDTTPRHDFRLDALIWRAIDISRRFGIAPTHVAQISKGKTWSRIESEARQ